MERAWDGQYEVCGRSEHAIWVRYKDGSTDEIAIERCKAARRLPGDESDKTPEKKKRGRPKGALKQAKEKTGESEEKKVTFVTDKQPDEGPSEEEEPVTKKPGRPRGSKTTTKDRMTTVRSRIFTRSRKT